MASSTSRRDERKERRSSGKTKKISAGCMSGILHLLTGNSRKRLPLAGKKVERAILTPGKLTLSPPPPPEKKHRPPPKASTPSSPPPPTLGSELRKLSQPRSPTLPPHLRRPVPSASPDSPRPALVARLMGLEEAVVPVSSPDEKRRRLLGALEKCTDDLDALKRIIQAVQVAEARRKEVVGGAREHGMGMLVVGVGDRKELEQQQQPSPVSVLDALASPRDRHSAVRCESPITAAVRSRFVEQPHVRNFPSGTQELQLQHKARITRDKGKNNNFYPRIVLEGPPRRLEHREQRYLEDFGFLRAAEDGRRRWRSRRSRAMVENVGEVWEEGMWEERLEFGRIELQVGDEIFRDLVEEMVVEMSACLYKSSFPLKIGRCRKRLDF